MSRLMGKVALVTGASRGIGHVVAAGLEDEGARVAALARSLDDGATDRRLNVRCDVTVAGEVRDAVARTIAAFGVPDIVVNNAGTFLLRLLPETSEQEFGEQWAVNALAPFLVLREVLPPMRARGSGHLVTIGSVVDHRPYAGNAAYGASKYGVRGLHEVLAEEIRGSGLRATLISPGATDTRLWDPLDPDHRDDLPMRESMLAPADVAEAVLFAVTRPPHVAVEWIRIMPTG
ncbi:MAG: SDR family oxidoreductase [Gemmatimonadales bacterium]|nr:SDR family oxidoreductase [Gemmatimonadales bacterium]